MSARVAVTLPGYNALTETDPNNFIFHSDYNTLKILATGAQDFTIPAGANGQQFQVAHGQPHIPFCLVYFREDSQSKVVAPNNQTDTGVIFMESVNVDYQNISMLISNSDSVNSKLIHVRWFAFELPL